MTWLELFKPSANFILCRINDSKITSDKLISYIAKNFRILIGIVVFLGTGQ